MQKKWIIALLIFLIALSIRLFFNSQFVTNWGGDEPYLFRYARNVFNGLYYGTEGVYWPPGFVFFMGLLFKIVGLPETPYIVSVKITQSILDSLTTVLIYSVTLKMFKNRTIAIISGILYSLLPAAILYTGMFLSETLWTFFIFSAIWLTYISADKQKWSLYALTGFVFALAALTRPTSIPLIFLAGLLFYLKDIKLPLKLEWNRIRSYYLLPTLIIVITLVVTISPWGIRNYVVVGEPVLFSVNPGINLYLAHNEKSTGMWVDMGPDDPVLLLRDHPDINREGKKKAYSYIFNNPIKTIKQAVKVHKWFWTLENYNVQRFGTPWLKLLYELYSFKLLALLSLIGILLSRMYWRVTLWLILYIIAYNGLIDFLYYAPRYRFAIEPFLIPFAAVTICIAGKSISEKLIKSSNLEKEKMGRVI